MGEQNRTAVGQIERLTALARESRDANAALRKAMDEQGRSAVAQIEKLEGWLRQERDASAELRKAMEEQKAAHAKEMGELRGVLAHPMVKIAPGVSGAGKRLGKIDGEAR
jgi:predicted  nucleic acid-binding Zn-ribbon protein